MSLESSDSLRASCLSRDVDSLPNANRSMDYLHPGGVVNCEEDARVNRHSDAVKQVVHAAKDGSLHIEACVENNKESSCSRKTEKRPIAVQGGQCEGAFSKVDETLRNANGE